MWRSSAGIQWAYVTDIQVPIQRDVTLLSLMLKKIDDAALCQKHRQIFDDVQL